MNKTIKLSENFWVFTIPLIIYLLHLMSPTKPFDVGFGTTILAIIGAIIMMALIYFGLRMEIE